MTVDDKIDIVHQVLKGFKMHKEVAREYRISRFVVSRLVRKAQNNKRFLRELLEKEDIKEQEV